jgi:hypothetical protein
LAKGARRSAVRGNTRERARRIARVRPSIRLGAGVRRRNEGSDAMPAIRFNIDVLNAILTGLGGGRHRRSVAALNEICVRLGGAGGHRRNLAAMNEWAVRLGGVGGHRRTLGALNEIDVRQGGTGGHRRSFVALEAIRARAGGPEPITSGSVRSQMMTNAGGTYAGGERVTHRQRDRTNTGIERPWFEYFHGRIAATGAVGMELESGLAGGKANRYRAAILTGIAGTAKNQAGATLTRATFFGMQGVDGCTVSGDGQTVTVPSGARFRTDRFALSLPAGAEYFIQTETVAADGSAVGYPIGRYRVPALGDLSFNSPAASTADLVFAKDWSGVWDGTPGGALGPVAVLGGGSAPVVIVDGDSIVAEAARPGTGHNGSDAGDALGVKCFVKRALNAVGYAFIDVSVSGTNVGNLMAGYGRSGLRAALMAYGSAVITDHLHNDRKSGTGFEATGGWSEAAPAAWNSTGLRVRCAWHNGWLRSKLKPGARVVRCTLAPATSSSDAWATVAAQTGKNDDASWAADYATAAAGDQFKLNDLIMRRGAYAGLAYGGAESCDAGYDLYAALAGTADGRWPAGGTSDGTHPSEALQIAAAADLAPRLPGLLGF